MPQADDRIILDDEIVEPRSKTVGFVAAGVAVVVSIFILGSIGTPSGNVETAPAAPTAPTQTPLGTMPDLSDLDLLKVVTTIREAGLDSDIVTQAVWLANAQVAAGALISQEPAPGTEIFDINQITLVMSSGGPTISWDEVPTPLQELVAAEGVVDRAELVLVVETGSGAVFKTDDYLFGPCPAVQGAAGLFYDREVTAVCDNGPPQTIVGWLADGSMFVIEGLPFQQFQDNASALAYDSISFGRQLWSVSQWRRAPSVTVDGEIIRVVGGHYGLILDVTGTGLDVQEVAASIEPLDIRGNLVLGLASPMAFVYERGIAGDPREVGQAARQYRGPADQPFAGGTTTDIVSTDTGALIRTTADTQYAVRTSAIGPIGWNRHEKNGWQFAIPEGFFVADAEGPLSVSTSELNLDGRQCGIFPLGQLAALAATDAYAAVLPSSPETLDPWPVHFDFFGQSVDLFDELPPVCLQGLDLEIRTSRYSYEGTTFEVVVAFGQDVDPEVRRQAYAVLDTLELSPVYVSDS